MGTTVMVFSCLLLPIRFHQTMYLGLCVSISVLWSFPPFGVVCVDWKYTCENVVFGCKGYHIEQGAEYYNIFLFFAHLIVILIVKYDMDSTNRDVYAKTVEPLKSVKILKQSTVASKNGLKNFSKLEEAREKLYQLSQLLALKDPTFAES